MLRTDGGGGVDTLTGGDGADTLTLGTGKDVVKFNATSEYGDLINDFVKGNGGDSIDFAASIDSSLVGTGYVELATSGTAAATDGVIVYTTDVPNYQTASDVATALDTLMGLGTSETRIFVVGDGTDARVWSWTDDGGGSVESTELTAVTDLTGIDPDKLTDNNFTDFTQA